jgi:hypothetical protein
VMTIGKSRVHPKEIGGKERGFIAARSRPDFDDAVAIVERIARNEQRRDLLFDARDPLLESAHFGARFLRHFRVINGNELARLRELVIQSIESGRQLRDRSQPCVFSSQLGHPL